MIKDFIARNKSVFVIGLLTLIIFMSIIIISEVRRVRKGNDSPKLIRVEDELETPNTSSSENDLNNQTNATNINILGSAPPEGDEKYGTFRIEHTGRGFVPAYAKAVLGQKIRWVNKTGTNVYIAQETSFFEEFKTPQLLPANGALEFRLYKDGEWGYRNLKTGQSGNIIILKP
jgi:hypothetical protein